MLWPAGSTFWQAMVMSNRPNSASVPYRCSVFLDLRNRVSVVLVQIISLAHRYHHDTCGWMQATNIWMSNMQSKGTCGHHWTSSKDMYDPLAGWRLIQSTITAGSSGLEIGGV